MSIQKWQFPDEHYLTVVRCRFFTVRGFHESRGGRSEVAVQVLLLRPALHLLIEAVHKGEDLGHGLVKLGRDLFVKVWDQ